MTGKSRILTVLLLLGAAAWTGAAEDPVRIVQQRAVVTRVVFDPEQPPSDMPKLINGEAAVTKSVFSIGSEVEVQVLQESAARGRHSATVKAVGVKLTAGLKITLWLPQGAPPELIAHEEGHRRLGERFYKDSAFIARRLANKCIGQTFVGDGKSADAARKAAIDKAMSQLASGYMQATQSPSARVNEIFDDITSHGQDQGITVNDAMAVSVELFRREQRGQ